MDERLFFKVDAEGTEAVLIETFLLLSQTPRFKPTWYISKHAHIVYSNVKVKHDLSALAKLYKCAMYAPASHQTSYTQDQLTKFTLSELPTINEATLNGR
jgi:hypothetical protein